MKKVYSVLFSILIIATFLSCSSLPKEPKEGVTIAAGRVEMNYTGYDDVSFNGKKFHGIQITVKETATGKLSIATTDNDGYFYFSHLKPNTPYQVVNFKFTSPNGSWLEWKDYIFDMFLSKNEDTILNLGTYYFSYNVKTNQSQYEIKNKDSIKYYLEQQFENTDFKIENTR